MLPPDDLHPTATKAEKCVYFCRAEHGFRASLHLEGPPLGLLDRYYLSGSNARGLPQVPALIQTESTHPPPPGIPGRSSSGTEPVFTYRRSG